MSDLYRVAIVVDTNFGEKLIDLSKRLHVWACASAVNKAIIGDIWAKKDKCSLESGVTSFDFKEDASPQEILLSILGVVDLHHGECSHNPAWTILEVYGVKPTNRIKSSFSGFGAGSFEETESGFVYTRELPVFSDELGKWE